MFFSRNCASFIIAAALSLSIGVSGTAGSTDGDNASASSVAGEWLLRHKGVQCDAAIMIGQDFSIEEAARARCEDNVTKYSGAGTNATENVDHMKNRSDIDSISDVAQELSELCFGIYDVGCSGENYFLCRRASITSLRDLAPADDGSCVSELTIPSTFEPRAALAPQLAEDCLRACTMPKELTPRTCAEQILQYRASSTGSLPQEPIPCDRRLLLVAHEGECRVCSGCNVCDFSNGTTENAASVELENLAEVHPTTAPRSGTYPKAPLIAAAAAAAALACAATSPALRRRASRSARREEGSRGFLDLEPTLLVE